MFQSGCQTLQIGCQWQKQALQVEVNLTVGVAPKDKIAAITAVSQLSAELIDSTDPKTFGHESFTHLNM